MGDWVGIVLGALLGVGVIALFRLSYGPWTDKEWKQWQNRKDK